MLERMWGTRASSLQTALVLSAGDTQVPCNPTVPLLGCAHPDKSSCAHKTRRFSVGCKLGASQVPFE